MAQTHNYETRAVAPSTLNSTNVLVGECGGLSAVVGEVGESNSMPGFIRVETEHGTLYLDPDLTVDVLEA